VVSSRPRQIKNNVELPLLREVSALSYPVATPCDSERPDDRRVTPPARDKIAYKLQKIGSVRNF